MNGYYLSPDFIERVRDAYIVRGLSTTKTADELGTTRGAVLGLSHRQRWSRDKAVTLANDLAAKQSRSKREDRPVRAKAKPPTASKAVAPKDAIPAGLGIPFPDRRAFQCAFIVDDTPFAQRVCGKTTEGGSWCRECARRVFSGVVAGRVRGA